MRYEVRQENGKWIVWDKVNDCAMKAVDRRTLSDRTRHTMKEGLPVLKRDSVTIQARPAMLWTQKEAQEWADTLNDLDQSGFVR